MIPACGDQHAVELPDAGEGACCYGAIMYGPQRCTCWDARYDQEQADPVPGKPATRDRLCADCAFRPGSPERLGVPGYNGSEGELDDLVMTGSPFYCHQGLRHQVSLVHPSGAEVQAHPGAYDPPIVDGVPYKADGTPGELCAGWAARRRKWLREEAEAS